MVRSQAATALLVGAATALIALVLSFTPLGFALEERVGLPWLFALRGAAPPPPAAVVVGINASTGRDLGLPRLPRDWPRAQHVKIIETLVARGASVIVFDFDFSRPGAPEDDFTLAEAIDASDRVILQEALEAKKIPLRTEDGQERIIWFEERHPPSAPLALAARAIAPFPLPKLGRSVFLFWTFKPSLGDAPTTASVALQLAGRQWYDRWIELLAEAGVPDVESLRVAAPDAGDQTQPWLHADPTRTPRQVRDLMVRLRSLFIADPSLADRLRAILASRYGEGSDSGERRHLAALVNLYAGSEQHYLNFYGPPGTIPTIPYQALIKGDAVTETGEPVDLAGKVVFIGSSDLHDPGQPDRFYSVFTTDDGVDLSGVEIMATAFSNLLNGEWITSSDTLLTVATLGGYGVAAGVLATLLPALAAVPVVAGFGLAYVAAAQWALDTKALWLPLAIPLLVQLPLALLGGILSQYLLKRRKERQATQAIRQYLPENIVRDLIRTDFNADSLNRIVHGTILASDMAGFTALSEHKRPEELAEFMNLYFDMTGRILKKYRIDFIEFHADTIMCAWTASAGTLRPEPLRAAIDLIDAIIAFGEQHAVPLKARIGIKDGEFYLGNTGGGARFSYSIVGDTANTAARLETLNKHLGTRILASQAAVGSGEDYVLRPLGRFRVFGRGEPIPVVEVLGTPDGLAGGVSVLCERFAAARDIFATGNWLKAANAFQEILDRWPDDGPSRFYIRLCGLYLNNPPTDDADFIQMAEK